MCLIFHRWSKWEQYETILFSGSKVLQQQRYCLKCNKVQDEPVIDFWSDSYHSRLLHNSEKTKSSEKLKIAEKKYSSTYKKK